MIEKFEIFAIRVKLANLTSRSSKNWSNLEKNLVNLRYLGYITAKFHKKYTQ